MYYFHSYINFKNKYYEELKPLPAPIREMMIFKKIVSEIPLEIRDGDLIPGRYGSTVRPGDPPPEKAFCLTENLSAEENRIKKELLNNFGIEINFDRGHSCLDYGYILENGVALYEKKVLCELEKENNSPQKQTMLLSVECVKIYMERFAILANEKYAETGDKLYLMMRDAISKVPYNRADSFYEAVVSVWTMHSLNPIADGSWSSISLGRMDRYLYPFYKSEIAKWTPEQEMKAYIADLFKLLNLYGDGACTLNIGGLDKDGNDMTNELSHMLLDTEKSVALASPIFVLRVNPKTPDSIIDKCIDKKLFTIGQPTFYGELPCRNALELRGIKEEKSSEFTVNSCMGVYLAGEEIASMWGCMLNMHLPLELAVNYGQPIVHDMPFDVSKCTERVSDTDTLLRLYEKYLREICSVLFKINRKNAMDIADNRPNAFLSMMTKGCISSGLDRATGAKYNTETVEAMACANTANAIVAIDTLVFKRKKYTLEEYIKAVQCDFDGCDDLLSDIRKCKKYGENDSYADDIMRRLCKLLFEVCRDYSHDNVYFIPSLHTLDNNVSFGQGLYTTLDGRMKGTPVAKNAGPTNDVRSPDPTNVIMSAAAIEQKFLSGGQPIDLYFDAAMLETADKRACIKALVKTYISLGGMQMQVNSVDVKVLEKAFEDPENHRNVVVRIGGFSRRFTELSKEAQLEFIQRFRLESKAVPQ